MAILGSVFRQSALVTKFQDQISNHNQECAQHLPNMFLSGRLSLLYQDPSLCCQKLYSLNLVREIGLQIYLGMYYHYLTVGKNSFEVHWLYPLLHIDEIQIIAPGLPLNN